MLLTHKKEIERGELIYVWASGKGFLTATSIKGRKLKRVQIRLRGFLEFPCNRPQGPSQDCTLTLKSETHLLETFLEAKESVLT